MNHQQLAFRRKVIYLGSMAALLLPLSLLGLPAAGKPEAYHVLAKMRNDEGLAQRGLGEIDPSSETMRFATFGFRGLAATLLWNQAHEHKKKENWTALRTVLDQIGRLQPNFVSVWRFQAWNLSYNVSAEWDDYRERYRWVLQGIVYLNKGQQYNARQTRLIWDEGWSTAHKIGRSDEQRQFRRLFRDRYLFAEGDDPLSYRPPERYASNTEPIDNWLCAKEVFGRAIYLADNQHVPLKGMSEEIYRSEPSKCQMRYADAIVEEGAFGEVARAAWAQAGREWDDFGDFPFVMGDDLTVTINDFDRYGKLEDELSRQLDDLTTTDASNKKIDGRSVRAELRAEKKQKLDPKERALFDKPEAERTQGEGYQVVMMQGKITVSDAEVAAALPASLQAAAQPIVEQIAECQKFKGLAYRMRHLLNYEFWRARCKAEASEEGVEARRLLYEAQQVHAKDSASPACIELYDKAFEKWHMVYRNHPALKEDLELGDRICDEVRKYKRALNGGPTGTRKWDKKTFILKDVIDARQPSPPID